MRTEPMQPGAAASVDGDSRSQYVLPDAAGDWLFVGEAQQADPTGGAGDMAAPTPEAMRLLERMFVALGLRPAEVVRVPFVEPRALRVDETAADDAADALAKRIEAVAPRVIVALGAGAARALLRTDATAAELRGRVHEAAIGSSRVPVVVSWHPLQLLAAPHEKAAVWVDLCRASEVAAAV